MEVNEIWMDFKLVSSFYVIIITKDEEYEFPVHYDDNVLTGHLLLNKETSYFNMVN